jgi:hypothetical protein
MPHPAVEAVAVIVDALTDVSMPAGLDERFASKQQAVDLHVRVDHHGTYVAAIELAFPGGHQVACSAVTARTVPRTTSTSSTTVVRRCRVPFSARRVVQARSPHMALGDA